MKNSAMLLLALVLIAMAFSTFGCKSWAPAANEPGTCSVDRQWVPPSQDADGKWTEGHCEWLPGKSG